MIVGRDEQRMRHLKFLVNQARDESRGYYHPEVGFNYRMTNIEAALGLAQMQRLDQFLTQKRAFQRIYVEVLGAVPGLRFPQIEQDAMPLNSEQQFRHVCQVIKDRM
jgi:perosamine synthetase